MKTTFTFILILASLVLKAQTQDTMQNGPVLYFSEKSHDFGSIKNCEQIEWVFKFKNVGDSTVIIRNACSTTGAVTPIWDKKPIPPRGTGEIRVLFNCASKFGLQNKLVVVYSNSKASPDRLFIRVNIIP
jgi:hypothetical protein